MTLTRLATEEDHQALAHLCADAASALRHQRGGPALVATWLEDAEDDHAFAAVNHHVVGGNPTWLVVGAPTALKGAAIAWNRGEVGCFAVYVNERHRQQGIGPQLGSAAIKLLEARAWLRSIDVLALPGDRALKSLLERSGFKARLLTMRREL